MEEVPSKLAGAILGAILGDVTNRSISFLVGKWSSPTEEERLESLRRLLLRVHAMVEEAEGRHVTSQAMLLQLHTLRMEMHRGYYTLDTFGCLLGLGDDVGQVSHSFALSDFIFSPLKRLPVRGGGSANEVKRALAGLEAAVVEAGVLEFVTLTARYPRLVRQPYSVYLFMDRCMFGRQMEMEHVVNFLLQADGAPGDERRLGVLPIVGPGKVGKSTLVHHACGDERVRNHFSILFINARECVSVQERATLVLDGAADHQKVLIIVELDGGIDEGSWTRLCSTSKSRHFPCGSKMIVTSRSDKIESLGTTLPLRLSFFTPEAYWYFFMVRTFGSMDVTEHPKLVSVAMEISRDLNGCFIAGNIFRGILKSSMNPRFWSLVLSTFKEFRKKNLFLFSTAHPVDRWEPDGPVHVPTSSKSTIGGTGVMILDNYETAASVHNDAEAPVTVMTVQELLFGSARPRGKFDVLACTSHIPPHYNHLFNCEVLE